jgi:glycerate 2-kinase
VNARLGILDNGKLAVIEMAEASGLRLVPPAKRNPLTTTTFGTGELIRAALDLGVKEIIVGVGGSATVDGGVGMAMALGAKFLDKKGDDWMGWQRVEQAISN